MIKKLVHSFWTEPYKDSFARVNGGFKNKYYFLLSSVLSFHSFKKNVPNSTFELVTDDRGKGLLVDDLGLPYDNVDLRLNNVVADSEIWSIGKLHAFQQDEPFLHVDLDAFLFKQIFFEYLDAKILVANDESNYAIYNNIMSQFKKGMKVYDTIYRLAEHDYSKLNTVNSFNMGVFGGTDINMIKEYTERSLKMYDLNRKWLKGINRSGITCFVEQIYLAYFLQEKKIKPMCLLNGNWNNAVDHIADAERKGFTHLVSESKRNDKVLALLEERVKRDHPEYYEKLQDVKNKSIQIYDLKIK